VTATALLHELPAGHPLRRRPLVGAQCRNRLSKEWRTIHAGWAIARCCYDKLRDAWTDTTEFRAPLTDLL